MKTKPWTPIDVDWWPAIAEAICGEWPEQAACMDLRWHADRVKQERLKRMPGRPVFRSRWGWTDYRVRQLMKAEDLWSDSKSTGNQQKINRESTAALRLIPENQAEINRRSTGDQQKISTRAELHKTQDTRTQEKREKREGLVQAFPPPSLSPSGWDSDLVLTCWRAAWPKAGRGPAPEPSDRAKAVSYTHLTLPTNREV